MVKQTLPKRDYEYYVSHAGDVMFEGKSYYRFQVYTLGSETISSADGTPVHMQFTYGWYYVDPLTKEVFEWSTGLNGEFLEKQ